MPSWGVASEIRVGSAGRAEARKEDQVRLSRRSVILGGFGLAGTSTAAYAAGIEAFELIVTPYRLTPPGWPASRRLTITVIADLHAGGPNMGHTRVRDVVDAANALRGDLVVLLGDYIAT